MPATQNTIYLPQCAAQICWQQFNRSWWHETVSGRFAFGAAGRLGRAKSCRCSCYCWLIDFFTFTAYCTPDYYYSLVRVQLWERIEATENTSHRLCIPTYSKDETNDLVLNVNHKLKVTAKHKGQRQLTHDLLLPVEKLETYLFLVNEISSRGWRNCCCSSEG